MSKALLNSELDWWSGSGLEHVEPSAGDSSPTLKTPDYAVADYDWAGCGTED